MPAADERGHPVVAVFGASASAPGDGHYEAGVELGRRLAEAGIGVATGGYGGLMEAVSRGAREAGGRVIGVTAPAVFPDRDGPNPHVTEERRAASLTERIHELVSVADAAIALHGSLGTATELLVAWNLAFVARRAGQPVLPVVAIGERWRDVVTFLAETLETDADLVSLVSDVAGAVDLVVRRLGERAPS